MLAFTAAVAGPGTPAAATAIPPEAAADILKKSDIATFAPESFRARFRITALPEQPVPMEVEVWRSGASKSLVRFLGSKEEGKYLLRLEGGVCFMAPGARKPVKLSPAHRLRGGASLDDILGIHYGRDYVIEGAMETQETGGPLVVLDLVARSPRVQYPKVRYFVRRATGRPVRAEYALKGGKTSSVVEFLEWEEGTRPVVRKLVLTDRLRSGLRTEVTLLEMEERTIPDGLFDLKDPTERRKLEERSSQGHHDGVVDFSAWRAWNRSHKDDLSRDLVVTEMKPAPGCNPFGGQGFGTGDHCAERRVAVPGVFDCENDNLLHGIQSCDDTLHFGRVDPDSPNLDQVIEPCYQPVFRPATFRQVVRYETSVLQLRRGMRQV